MPLKPNPPSQHTGIHTSIREIRGCTLGKNPQRWLKQLKIKPPDSVGWWWIVQNGFLTRLTLKAERADCNSCRIGWKIYTLIELWLFSYLTGAAQNIMGSPIPHIVHDNSQVQPPNPPYSHGSLWKYFLNSSYWFMLLGTEQRKLLFSQICTWTVKTAQERIWV